MYNSVEPLHEPKYFQLNALMLRSGCPDCQTVCVLRWWGRRNNISKHSASESNCLEYSQGQLLLRGCEVFAPKTEPIRVTDIAKIYGRGSMARLSWTNYFCRKPADGLMSDSIGWFLGFFEEVAAA